MDVKVGSKVSKRGGDYRFDGVCVSVFTKTSGAVLYVVEDDRGGLHIYSRSNLDIEGDAVAPQRSPQQSGEACSTCGNFSLVRSGTCLTCQVCGTTTGCG